MSALVARGLARVSKKGGRYTAAPTDAGRYFHDHGQYPADSAGGRRAARVRAEKRGPQAELAPSERTGTSVSGIRTERAANPPRREEVVATPPDLPHDAPQRIVKPHPAVRSLMARPIALPKDANARRRAFVAAHLLIQAAEQAGFKIEGHTQPKQRGNEHPFRGETLVTLDAGHRAVPVRIGEFEKGVDHVLTPDETADKERWGHSWAPRYDYPPTGLLFFRVYGGSSSTRLLESSTKWLGDHVPRVIALARKATEVALADKERARSWKQEQGEQREAARVLAKRQAHYEKWERSLLDQAKAWEQATRLRAFLASFGSTQRGATAGAFLEWASGYADMSDPTTTLQVPVKSDKVVYE